MFSKLQYLYNFVDYLLKCQTLIYRNLYKGKQFYRAFSIINLTIAMFALNLLSVISELIYTSTETCKYLAPLLHLTLFSVFNWITCDTIYIFLSVVFVSKFYKLVQIIDLFLRFFVSANGSKFFINKVNICFIIYYHWVVCSWYYSVSSLYDWKWNVQS